MLNTENFNQFIQQERAVVFFHKQGCSNCEKMRPVFEAFKKNNPDIPCDEYLCTKQDEITKQYPFNTFPAIYIFANGVAVGHTEGIATYESIQYPFLDDATLKIIYYDYMEMIEQGKKAQNDAQIIKQILDIRKIPRPVSVDPLDAPLPEPLSKEKEDCTNCEA